MSTAPVTLLNANPGAVAASYTTASVTPAANTKAIVFGTYDKASLLASKPTISDSLGTLTWSELGNVHTSNASNPDLWIVAWISNDLGPTPAAMTVTVAATGGRAGTCSIITVLSADTNGTALQVASAEDLATGDPSFTFASAPGATNIKVGCNWHGGGNAITKPAAYTNLFDNTPTNVASRRHEVFYNNTTAAQGPNASSSGNIRSVVLAIELAPASASTYTLPAAAGSYALTGTAATLKLGRVVAAAAGSYALSGSAATLRRALPLVAGAGSYSLTGATAGLLHSWKTAAGAGSYSISGTAASLLVGKVVPAAAGAYSLAGSAASMLLKRLVAAGSGSYALTGTAATLTYSGSPSPPANEHRLSGQMVAMGRMMNR